MGDRHMEDKTTGITEARAKAHMEDKDKHTEDKATAITADRDKAHMGDKDKYRELKAGTDRATKEALLNMDRANKFRMQEVHHVEMEAMLSTETNGII
jgi:hypothetical protein